MTSKSEGKQDFNVHSIRKHIVKHLGFRERLRLIVKHISDSVKSKPQKKAQKSSEKKRTLKEIFDRYLRIAGIRREIRDLRYSMRQTALTLTAGGYIGLLFHAFLQEAFSINYLLLVTFVGIPVLFAGLFSVILLVFSVYLDVRIYRRRSAIEAVLPDFLQLASANIRSGMTVDKALWYAIRPQFGVLAHEMELVAKQTMSGVPLEKALWEFSEKYDSPILRRSVHLIIEGISAGGEIGDLLDRISVNLQESHALRKEMAANVTSYIMFISFAALLAAPVMYGLALQLINTVQDIMGSMNLGGSSQSQISIGASMGEGGIVAADFTIFAIVNLAITSIFAGLIISSIQKGDIKSGLHRIPVFIAVSVALFLLAAMAFNSVFGNIF